ncbi:MAG: ABC transporter substrate-binding protein [Marinibacterium sp.]|nr:ABC transporter substrate-binding protein [Marinibacterium sp.]
MFRITSHITALALACLPCAALAAEPASDAADLRVISVGGATTEIIYALGAGDQIIARDTTSTFPPEANDLPNVGYARSLSPEGVLSLEADMVISTENAGPPETLEVLDAADVDLILLPETYTVDGIADKVTRVGAALDREAEAAALVADLRDTITAASDIAHARSGDSPPKVLFVLGTASGRITAAGANTGADGILKLAGAQNAMTGLSGYKQVSSEAIIAAAPDAILMMDRGGDHAVADDDLFALPAIATTPAGRNKRVIRMDGLRLLGFGPRTAEAVHELSRALHEGDAQ